MCCEYTTHGPTTRPLTHRQSDAREFELRPYVFAQVVVPVQVFPLDAIQPMHVALVFETVSERASPPEDEAHSVSVRQHPTDLDICMHACALRLSKRVLRL